MKKRSDSLFELFLTFAKIGATTFGGGYAMLPILKRELCENRGWATEEELLDYYAIGQCTPGVIAVNTAGFAGKKLRGIPGAIAATLGVIFPSLVIIIVIAALLSGWTENPYVKNAFAGIRVCVGVLVINTVINMWKKSVKGVFAISVFALCLILALFTKIPTAALVVAAAVSGIIYCSVQGKKGKEERH